MTVICLLGVQSRQAQAQDERRVPRQVEGHWGEDAIGFAWQESDSIDDRWQQTDVGPFLAGTYPMPRGFVEKGLAVRLGGESKATICYDTKNLTIAGIWHGGFLRFDPARFGLIRHPAPVSDVEFSIVNHSGWPNHKTHWKGLAQFGTFVTAEYEIDQTLIRETPSLVTVQDKSWVVREFQVAPHDKELNQLIASELKDPINLNPRFATWKSVGESGTFCTVAIIADENSFEGFARDGNFLQHRIPKSTAEQVFRLVYRVDIDAPTEPEIEQWMNSLNDELNQTSSDRSATRIWTEAIQTVGERGQGSEPYVVDTITLPFDNPYKALFFVSGHDFFSDGRAAICTVHGDVWIVDGIDDDLDELTWTRFATGLYQPLGLRILNDQVYVLGRDQLTCLLDRNQDGEADYYQNINNDGQTSTGTHDYAACLETDSEGNFYCVRGNTGVERIKHDGSELEVISTGLRNANGMGAGPNDLISVAPQEGEWTPASFIAYAEPGTHYGYRGPQVNEARPLGYDPPLVWIPRLVDNSSGGQVWVTSQDWGPFEGMMIHLSYGRCWMMLVPQEEVKGVRQGAVIRFPIKFDSGVSRGRFNELDGQLYVSGLRGWSTSAVQDGCFQRVRYTGKPVQQLVNHRNFANGIRLDFSTELDPNYAQDPDNFFAQRWNYRYSASYGSPEFSVSKPDQTGRDIVSVRSSTVSDDGRSIFLEIPDHQPSMQMSIAFTVRALDGGVITQTLYPTIHRLPDEQGVPGPHASATDETRLNDQELRKRLSRGWTASILNVESDSLLLCEEIRSSHSSLFSQVSSSWTNQPIKIQVDGFLDLDRKQEYQFRLLAHPAVEMRIDDELLELQQGSQTRSLETQPITLRPGVRKISIRFSPDLTAPILLGLDYKEPGYDFEPIHPSRMLFDPNDSLIRSSLQSKDGAFLFVERGCVECHGPSENEIHLPETYRQTQLAPDLKSITSRRRKEWLATWIVSPNSFRPHTSMPTMLDADRPEDQQLAQDIVAWLETLDPGDSNSIQPRDDWTIDRFTDDDLVDLGEQYYEQLGCISCHRFTAPETPDTYRRTSLANIKLKYEPNHLVNFIQQPHAHRPGGPMPDFRLTSDEAGALASYLWAESVEASLSELKGLDSSTAKPERIAAGEKAFTSLGCIQCHTTDQRTKQSQPYAPALGKLNTNQGCLDPVARESRHIPKVNLEVNQLRAIQSFLGDNNKTIPTISAATLSQRAFSQLNCQACHNRDGEVSPFIELVLDEGNLGLTPELLPDLTWAGEKLQTRYVDDLLSGELEQRARPWLAARMPQFPGYAEIIAHGLADEHGVEKEAEQHELNTDLAKIGFQLAAPTKGFDCRSCHGYGDQPPLGDEKTQLALGVNFSLAPDRIRKDFYDRWMNDPLRIDPLSKMPRFIENGESKVADILDGDAQKQFDALWHYILSADREESLRE